MVEDKRWRFDTQESSSSVELSVSSFTNGTHSSLNSEVEEDELACSIEPSTQYNPYIQFNGHLGGKIACNTNIYYKSHASLYTEHNDASVTFRSHCCRGKC